MFLGGDTAVVADHVAGCKIFDEFCITAFGTDKGDVQVGTERLHGL